MKWFVVVFAGLLAWGEAISWWVSRRKLGAPDQGPEVVIVLGYRNANPHRANALNRWRVRAALRSVTVAPEEAWIVFCGGDTVGTGVSEAELMARYAVKELGYRGRCTLEGRSMTTWENVQNAVPLIAGAGQIKFVSSPHHALKARMYLRRIHPELSKRVVRARDYRFGEWPLCKLFFAIYGTWDIWRMQCNVRLGVYADTPPRQNLTVYFPGK